MNALVMGAAFAIVLGGISLADRLHTIDGPKLATSTPHHSKLVATDHLECFIRTETKGNRLTLNGDVKTGTERLNGRYHFWVKRQGTSGSSKIFQSGDFNLAAYEEMDLGKVVLPKSHSGWEAGLTLSSSDNDMLCSTTLADQTDEDRPQKKSGRVFLDL